jgi:hypothetical protein
MLWLIVACLRCKSAFLSRYVVMSSLFFLSRLGNCFEHQSRPTARTTGSRWARRLACRAAGGFPSSPRRTCDPNRPPFCAGRKRLARLPQTALSLLVQEFFLSICIVCLLGHGGACLHKASSPRLHVSAARGRNKTTSGESSARISATRRSSWLFKRDFGLVQEDPMPAASAALASAFP